MQEERTGAQVLRSVLAYLAWRAGSPWRRLSDPKQRNANERWEYLEAARLVRSVYYGAYIPGQPAKLEPALPDPRYPEPSPEELELAEKPRPWLVNELLQANHALTDRRLLSRLGRPKLARMLLAARTARASAAPLGVCA